MHEDSMMSSTGHVRPKHPLIEIYVNDTCSKL